MELENKPAEIDLPTALSALAHEVVKLNARTDELKEADADQLRTMTATANALERILQHHQIACRRICQLFVTLGADFDGAELTELRSLFNLEPPEGDKGPEQN
jgi:hypothetical protein